MGECCLLVEAAGPVGRAHQRSGQHADEPESLGVGRQIDELIRVDPTIDRMVAR